MKLFACLLRILTVSIGLHSVLAASPNWRIIDTSFPSHDLTLVGYSVAEFGAVADGKTDNTAAFQKALDAMSEAGGGIVFAPEGLYAFEGNLVIPDTVTLRGEWRQPSAENPEVVGTVLMPRHGKNQPDAQAFISLRLSAGVRDLSIWYPEQSPDNPTPYPYTLEQTALNNATFQNLTLVNAYQGIKIGPQPNELHFIHNVYGTPLKTGINYDSTTDIGRIDGVSFSPEYWENSGLDAAPTAQSSLRSWLLENATGIHMQRSDWEYVNAVSIEGYHVGFRVTQGARGAANAQFRKLEIRNCETALYVEKTNPYGMAFTDCRFEGKAYAVKLSPAFDSAVAFTQCVFAGKMAIDSSGDGVIMLDRCAIQSGDITQQKGAFTASATIWENASSNLNFGSDLSGAIFNGCQVDPDTQILAGNTLQKRIHFSEQTLEPHPIPEFPSIDRSQYLPGSSAYKVVFAEGVKDATGRIQKAIDALAPTGGTVILPGKDYKIRGSLTLAPGVELRGVHDVPHHSSAGGSVLHIYPEDESPTVVLSANSGLRGLSFHYPKQNIKKLKAYPFLIQGQGAEVYVINVNAVNPYKLLDLSSFQNDRHYVDYLSGSPIQIGISVGGQSVAGDVRNVQFNPHYWARLPHNPGHRLYKHGVTGGFGKKTATNRMLWDYQKENMEALIISDSTDQFLYQNFVFGSRYGIRFTSEKSGGPKNLICHGHGTDGSKIGAFFEKGAGFITLLNTQLVSMSTDSKIGIELSEHFDAKAILTNSLVWGQPDALAHVKNGTLSMHNLHANRYGRGIRLLGGDVVGSNINFQNMDTRHIEQLEAGQGLFEGIIVRGPFATELGQFAPQIGAVVERPEGLTE